jgi:hypothetical protein
MFIQDYKQPPQQPDSTESSIHRTLGAQLLLRQTSDPKLLKQKLPRLAEHYRRFLLPLSLVSFFFLAFFA